MNMKKAYQFYVKNEKYIKFIQTPATMLRMSTEFSRSPSPSAVAPI